jgi:L-threonylcarbamoyladenylate synthase
MPPAREPDSNRQAPPQRGASLFAYPPTPENIDFFASHLKRGHLAALPTETVYGLAACAFNEAAVSSIFSLKGRPLLDPLILHIQDLEELDALAEVSAEARELARAFWPGPLTFVLPKKARVPDLVTAGLPTVAVRMPAHSVTRELLRKVGEPLAAPSANPFGRLSPTRPEHVQAGFGDACPYILDGGPCAIGLESTIIDLRDTAKPQVLRPGAISAEAISKVLQRPVARTSKPASDATRALPAPGMLSRHYSPKTPLNLFAGPLPLGVDANMAVVTLARRGDTHTLPGLKLWLSENGCPSTAAASLFDLLHQLDAKGLACIHCEVPPADTPDPFLQAIRNRLLRAAAK